MNKIKFIIKEKKKFIINIFTFIFIMIILITTLYVGETVGLSDNGDFARVMQANLITYKSDSTNNLYVFNKEYNMAIEGSRIRNKFSHIFDTYEKVTGDKGLDCHSTVFLFVKVSKLLNLIYNYITGNNIENYNIFWLAFLYILIYSFAIMLILSSIRTQNHLFNTISTLIIILVFCDTGYTLYFNSFFGEAMQLCSLLLCIGTAGKIIRNRGGALFIVIFFISDFLFIGSKQANVPIGILLACFGLTFILLYKRKTCKLLIITGVVIMFSCSIYYLNIVPSWMNKVTSYQSVFFGILKDSPSPEKDLIDLGLSTEYVSLKNTNSYLSDYSIDTQSQKFEEGFYQNISKGKILKFYLLHPIRFYEKINISCLNSSSIKPIYLGNYGADHDRFELTSRFSLWSSLRKSFGFNRTPIIFSIILIFLIIIIFFTHQYLKFKKRDIRFFMLIILMGTLLISSLIALIIPILGNGEADLAKHMFGFIQFFDIIFLFIVIFLLFIVTKIKVSKEISNETRRIYACYYLVFIVIPFLMFALLNNRMFISNSSNKLVNGSYISLGKYAGNNIKWRVINIDNDTALLLCDNTIPNTPFDDGSDINNKYGKNDWQNSSIRFWLNNDFIKDFAHKEKLLIKEINNRLILSRNNLNMKEGGTRPLYCNIEPSLADKGYVDAYYMSMLDKVFILDIKQLHQYVIDSKVDKIVSGDFWLRTPYYSNDSMVRYASKDGYILYKDAAVKSIGVVPAICINSNVEIYSGNGGEKLPFLLR